MAKVYKQIQELGKVITGKTPSTADNNLWDGEVPFITPTDIIGYDTFYQACTERTISDSGVKKQKNTLLPKDSVCITCIGSTIGKSCLTKVPSITNQQINSIIPNAANDNRYILYLLRYNLPYMQMIGGASGSGTPIICKNKFEKFKFLVEDNLPTQQKIASVLSTYDTLIENNTKRIRLLEQMAENLYKEWFVRFRFPGHENVEMIDGLPKGWKIQRYADIATITAGGDCPQVCSNEKTAITNIPIYSNGITNDGLYGYTDKARIEEPCITISARGTVGFVCLHEEPFVPIVRLLAVVPTNLGVYYLFHSSKYNDLEGNGTSQQQLTKPMLAKRKIIIPTKNICDKFEDFMVPIYKQINYLKKQSSLLSRQRDLLLPRLMSGKLEVTV